MCGIVGVVGLGERDRSPAMRAMREAIFHRGPDAAGEYCDPHASLGIRRLRIIDLVTGDQPQCDEARNLWTVFNGEIYNFAQLRDELSAEGHRFTTRSDTEVIVHLYEREGERFVERLDGMFAIALWDARARTLVLVRDRLGKKPMVLYRRSGELYFASEHQALLAGLPGLRRAADPAAIGLYLRLGYVPAPFDAFRGFEKLEPAEVLVWRAGEVRRWRYWSPPTGHREVSERDAAHAVRTLFDRAVAKRLVADVPVGAFLSGGVDSSVLVASMASQSRHVRTFTIGFDEQDYSEVVHARRVAEHFGTEHHEFTVRPDTLAILPTLVRHYGEPYADSSAVPTYYLSKLTREFVTVALAGDGGDELFAGYDRHRAAWLGEKIDALPAALRSGIASLAAAALPHAGSERSRGVRLRRFLSALDDDPAVRYDRWVGVFAADWLRAASSPTFREQVERADDQVLGWIRGTHGDAAARAEEFDLARYLPDDLLVKVDIASMANSLEVRAPFLDRELVEYAIRLPTRLKIRGRRGKWILRRAFADVLPAESMQRAKQGFGLPIGSWLRTSLRTLLDDVVLSPVALDRGYVDPACVRVLVEEHLRGVDHTHRLWSLIMLELWHREFIDG